MRLLLNSRQTLLWVVIVLYLIPLVTISGLLAHAKGTWFLFSLGLLITFSGAFALFWLMQYWESHFSPARNIGTSKIIAHLPEKEISTQELTLRQQLDDVHKGNEVMAQEMHLKNEELVILQRERDSCQQRYDAIYHEFSSFKNSSQFQLEQHALFIQGLQDTIDQKNVALEKKQQQIIQLETKVTDLTYEIKTLLHLAESVHSLTSEVEKENILIELDEEEPPSNPQHPQIHTCHDAAVQLKRCLDIAQKMTGSSHFSNETSRLRDLPVDNFALNLRRLCDRLGSENQSAILLYSPKENRLIFANNTVKNLLGWSPEKLLHSFEELIQVGGQEWRNCLSQINLKNDSQTEIVLKTKKGHDLLVHCHLGVIPTGVFRYHTIAIIHPA